MKVLFSVFLLFGLAFAKDKLGDLLTEAVAKSVCNGFKCDGKYEQCEVVSGSPLCVKNCPDCNIKMKKQPVCGSDGKTYKNLCSLQQAECMENVIIDQMCEGKCPCDPKEVVAMDPPLVKKLQKLRLKFHLEKRFKEEMERETAAEKAFNELRPSENKKPEYLDIITEDELQNVQTKKMKKWQKKKLQHLKDVENVQKQILQQQSTKDVLKPDTCTKQELSDLPGRLLDWFHVLKTNNLRKQNPGKKSLKELKFLDAKLRAMYVSLACKQDPQRPDSEVFCLQPVQWMFDYLDSNKDNTLQHTELADIEEADGEHCMKRFFLDCDRNRNGTVEKVEFCRCLCVEPPCTKVLEDIPTLLVSGVPQPVAGLFTPKCDEDGFYIPKQCDDKECFCVDRNGQELPETRAEKDKELECADNTIRHEPKKVPKKKPAKVYSEELPEYLLP